MPRQYGTLLVCALLAAGALPFIQAGALGSQRQQHDADGYPAYTDTLNEAKQAASNTNTLLPQGLHDPTTARTIEAQRVAAAKGPQEAGSEGQRPHVPILTILTMTCFMSAMAGLGAVPFFFCGKLKNSWAGLANAVACGVMLAASFDLLHEGAPYSPTLTIAGMVMGCMFIKSSQEWLSRFEDAEFQDLSGADARKAMLIVGVMAAHALGEGSGVGVSFSGNRGWAQGTLVTIAIGLHNIPEGMAVATVMVSKGTKPQKALFWSLFCAFPQALVAVPSYIFVETFQSLLPVALGFAAGCMIWIVSAELMPDALEAAPHPQVATAVTLSAAWLQGLSMLIARLERPDGALSSPIQADASTLMQVVMCLAPAVAVQVAVAVGASQILPSMPAALGATAGVMTALGGTCLIWLMAAGQTSTLHTMLWAGIGGLMAMLLWRNVLKPPPPPSTGGLEVRRSLEEQLSAAAAAQRHPDEQLYKHHPSHAESTATMQRSMGNGGAYMRPGAGGAAVVSIGTINKPHAGTWTQDTGNGLMPPPLTHGNGYSAYGTAGPDANTNGNGQYHPDVFRNSMQQQQNGSYPAGTQYGYPVGVYQNGGGDVNKYSYNGNMNGYGQGGYGKEDGANGHLMMVNLGEPPHSQQHPHQHQNGVEHGSRWLGSHHDLHQHHGDAQVPQALPSLSGTGQHGKVVRGALMGALLLVCHAGCSVGMQVAGALAAHGTELGGGGGSVMALFGHWLAPLVLQGLPVGLACIGLGKAIGGAGCRPAVWMAVATASAVMITVVSSVACSPLGVAGATFEGWDRAHWSETMRAACAGALLVGGTSLVWPAAAVNKPAKAQTGLLLGLIAVGLCELAAVGLCYTTPYCVK